ncbi:5-aminolevulinate synthase [Defluviimonas aestuarii]|uniref:5-aminolevulinate synthase n=1 Tax=Albidovulum aestuarii TaxID=1130726 RepID=UPI00249B670B|nr:5-aminolevulinate synthase [Defluviimonas aestuarii]MDI3337911.1 5-aminolevulinate synthase [Defluviimonas aestuarii]
MTYLLSKPIFLIFTAALAYAIATAGIKMASNVISPSALVLIAIGFTIATLAEVVLLRQASLGVIYIAIITAETLMVLTLAAMLGEGLTTKQLFGAVFVLAGIFIVGE